MAGYRRKSSVCMKNNTSVKCTFYCSSKLLATIYWFVERMGENKISRHSQFLNFKNFLNIKYKLSYPRKINEINHTVYRDITLWTQTILQSTESYTFRVIKNIKWGLIPQAVKLLEHKVLEIKSRHHINELSQNCKGLQHLLKSLFQHFHNQFSTFHDIFNQH